MMAAIITEFFGCILLMTVVNVADDFIVPALMYFAMTVVLGRISGGHLNPSVSLGVYIEQRKYASNACFLLMLMFAQALGSFCALMIGFLLRVSIPVDGLDNEYYFIPGVKGLTPPILATADGMPAYGQVMLAEIFGSTILVLTILFTKRFHYVLKIDRVVSAIPIPVVYIAMQMTFAELSGSNLNPATALSSIVWQNLTYQYDPNAQWSRWTYEYASCYLVGPLLGGFFAGHIFNLLSSTEDRMNKVAQR